MHLFNEKKNLFFGITHMLINNQSNLSEKEFRKAFKESGFTEYNYDFASALIGKKIDFADIQLFRNDNGNISPLVKAKAPYLLSNLEKSWLEEMHSNAAIKKFTNDENIKSTIIAMREKKAIICDNESLYGDKFNDVLIIPCKLEYSIRMDMFWLIGYSVNDKYMVKMSLERLTVKKLIENNFIIDLDAEYEKQKEAAPIVLEIRDEKGVLERALHAFSTYRKDGVFDKERNLHIVKIYYYSFDEYELIKDIITLGGYAKVISPTEVKQKIYDKINRQIALFA